VKDSAAVTGQDAQTKFILELVQDTTVTPKSGTPTVDKEVQDEPDDAEEGATEGWGETADHAINESFQFKLTANIPNDPDMNAYKSYYINFVDTWSEGVTFEHIDSVMVNGTKLDNTQYTVTQTENGMNVSINDIIPYLGGQRPGRFHRYRHLQRPPE
jgi:fimbrial isopeptide formation D2 family protein